jgi:hypothetical protein
MLTWQHSQRPVTTQSDPVANRKAPQHPVKVHPWSTQSTQNLNLNLKTRICTQLRKFIEKDLLGQIL